MNESDLRLTRSSTMNLPLGQDRDQAPASRTAGYRKPHGVPAAAHPFA